MLLYVSEVFIMGLVFLFVITQMLFPLIRNTKMFPLFRKEGKLNEKLAEVNQQVVEKGIETEITKTKKKAGV